MSRLDPLHFDPLHLEETLFNIKEAAEGWLEVAALRITNETQAQIAEIGL